MHLLIYFISHVHTIIIFQLSFNLQDTVANAKTLVHQAFVKIARNSKEKTSQEFLFLKTILVV